MAEENQPVESQESQPQPPVRKSKRMSLQDWQAKGGQHAEHREEIPWAEQLTRHRLRLMEEALLKPHSPTGMCMLPNGIVWQKASGQKVLLTQLQIRELTGDDYNVLNEEETSYYNKVHSILGSCVTSVASEDGSVTIRDPHTIAGLPYSMMFLDRLMLLYALRRLSQGNEYPFIHPCPNPKCKKESLYVVDLSSITVTPMADPMTRDYTTQLPSGADSMWSVMTGQEERELSLEKESDKKKNSLTRAVAARLRRIVYKGAEPRIVDLSATPLAEKIKVVNRLGGMDIQVLWDDFNRIEGDLDSNVDVKCKFCFHEFRVATHTQDTGFFFPLLLLRTWSKNSQYF